MRQITCPVCKTPPDDSPKNLSLIPCRKCETRWTFLMEEVDEKALYTDEVYSLVDNRKSIFERVIFSEAEKVLLKAKKINPEASLLLDFGSGKGQFLAVAKELGWEGLGIETAIERAVFAQEKYGVQVQSELYFGGKIGQGSFDLITLNHVLEHLPEPMVLVKNLLDQNLASEGIVYLEVPRADSWQAAIAGTDWIHWDIPRHLTHWTASTLQEQFSNIGYELVQRRSFSVHLGVLGMLQALLSRVGFGDNLILRLKRKKTLGLLALVAIFLPFAWVLEVISVGFDKSGILGIYLKRRE